MLRAVVVAFVAALTPLAAQQADDAPAVVSGRVVDATSGRPIPGVIVTPAGSAVVIDAASPVPPRALTNGLGEFVVRGLKKGTLYFTAGKSGYADATYNQRRPGGSGQGIPLRGGQRLNNVEIRMWRHASLSGTVVDEAGEPAVGVRVQAFEQQFVAGRKRFSAGRSGVTDDRGIYRIANLMPGSYTVAVPSTQNSIPDDVMDMFFGPSRGGTPEQRTRVARELTAIGSAIVPKGSQYAVGIDGQTYTLAAGTLMPQPAPRGGLLVYTTVFYPSATRLSQAAVIALRSGEERGWIDLQMRPVRTFPVSGTVVDSAGPAGHVAVRLADAGSSDAVEPLEVATTMTSSTGEFRFAAVPAGQFVLSVLRPPREPIDTNENSRISTTPAGDVTLGIAVPPASANPPPPPVPLDATLYAQLPLAVGESEITGLVVPLVAAPRVSGRVEFEGTSEKPSASTLPRIRLNLDPADGSRLADSRLAAEAGHPQEDGTFLTLGVPPGRYVLRVNPPSGWSLKGAFIGGIDITDQPVDLSGQDLSGVVITFTDRPARLTGVVRSGMNPDDNAIVIAFPTDASAWRSRGAYARRMRIARPARDGTYTIEGLVPGEYHVVAVHEEAFPDWQDPKLLEALARVARQVRVIEGERHTEDLTSAVIR